MENGRLVHLYPFVAGCLIESRVSHTPDQLLNLWCDPTSVVPTRAAATEHLLSPGKGLSSSDTEIRILINIPALIVIMNKYLYSLQVQDSKQDVWTDNYETKQFS